MVKNRDLQIYFPRNISIVNYYIMFGTCNPRNKSEISRKTGILIPYHGQDLNSCYRLEFLRLGLNLSYQNEIL